MSKKKTALVLFAASAIVYVTQNMYFGWNRYPESDLEQAADVLTVVLFFLGARYDIVASVVKEIRKDTP